ncbi:hypothetical protein J7T55_013464 [Diaporthe amygdali]|uniref:uncharacterized protein n=1 Tax=Phomopsis amygdali TaxID=1214568 RepID=UPI0022FEC3E4|nr:uncharacterized protein J7T55_013464 [Diaporthe amygdali]KAJ0119227.1 hypothetical protein J7T55_013464 [Diaporthe amygdali]
MNYSTPLLIAPAETVQSFASNPFLFLPLRQKTGSTGQFCLALASQCPILRKSAIGVTSPGYDRLVTSSFGFFTAKGRCDVDQGPGVALADPVPKQPPDSARDLVSLLRLPIADFADMADIQSYLGRHNGRDLAVHGHILFLFVFCFGLTT